MTKVINDMEQVHPAKSYTCNRCLSVWPNVPYQEGGTAIFEIEEDAKELLNSACEVCQILGMALQVHQEGDPSMKRPLLRWERWLGHSGVAVFHNSDGTREKKHDQTGIVRVWYPDPSIADDWKSVETEGQRINFDTIRGWLEECSKSHYRCRRSIQVEPCNLKVIDCMSRAIITAPEGCRYVALSYVWGGLIFKTETNTRALPSELPRTIEDSMKATLLLGYRYLWVE
jgi:hypothetical protein